MRHQTRTHAVSVPPIPPQPVLATGAKEERLKLRAVLHSKTVNPVKVGRLEFFLQGYDTMVSVLSFAFILMLNASLTNLLISAVLYNNHI